MARAFAERGDRVHAWDIRGDELEETAAGGSDSAPGAEGRTIRPMVVDVTDPDAVTEAVRAVESRAPHGRVDVLVNNAGGVLGQAGRPVETVSPEDWRAIVEVNMSAPF